MAGFCPQGPECEHTHPKFDYHNLYLRIKPDPIRATQAELSGEEEKDGVMVSQIEGNASESNAISV